MAQSELECFSGVKTAQNSKAESGIEREKEAEGRCTWGDFTSRKTGRMHRETASEMASLPWSQNNRTEKKRYVVGIL